MAETEHRAAPRVREYETIFLLSPDLTDENVGIVKDRVRGIVDRNGGKFLRFTVWGKKRTMYPIGKQSRAIYVQAHYLGGTSLVAEIERNLRNLDAVTRFMSKRLADDADPAAHEPQDDLTLGGDSDDKSPLGSPDRDDFSRDDDASDDESSDGSDPRS